MQRLLQHPKTWYALLISTFATIGILQVLGGGATLTDAKPIDFFGINAPRVDSVLRRLSIAGALLPRRVSLEMRKLEVRANILSNVLKGT